MGKDAAMHRADMLNLWTRELNIWKRWWEIRQPKKAGFVLKLYFITEAVDSHGRVLSIIEG